MFPDPKISFLRLFRCLRPHHANACKKINGDETRILTDTVQKLRCSDAQRLGVVPGEDAGGRHAPSSGAASVTACCKINAAHFTFLPFFVKAKILFGFLLVSGNRD